MKNFEQSIRDLYDEQVNPVYNETAWESYNSHVDEKKTNHKNRLAWVFLLGLITLTLVLLGVKNSAEPELRNDTSIVAVNIEPVDGLVEKRSSHTSGNSITQMDNSLSDGTEQSIPSSSIIFPANDISKKHNTSKLEAASFSLGIEKEKQEVMTREESEESVIQFINDPHRRIPQMNALFIKKHDLITNETYLDLNNKVIEQTIPIHRKADNHRVALGLRASFGQLSHRVIEKNNIFTGMAFVYWSFSKHFRLKTDVGIDRIKYSSRIFSLNLGLRSKVADSGQLDFERIINTSYRFNAGLGIDYLQPLSDNWSIAIGQSLVYSKELRRNLSYEFVDFEDMNSKLVINDKVPDLQTFPLNVRFDLSVEYSINQRLNLEVIGSLMRQLSKEDHDLPDQSTISIGILKKL